MTRHFSTRDLFRQMPNALLACYFEGHELFGDLDFSSMKETQPDERFAAWLTLTDSQRNQMDAEFREIFELSDEKGFRAITDEAEWPLTNETRTSDEKWDFVAFVQDMAELPNRFERAMITFLDHHEFWEGAVHFYHADSLTRLRSSI